MLDLLEKKQLPTGAFKDETNTYDDLLYTSFILYILSEINEKGQLDIIKQKAFNWLISQKNDDWVFSENLAINFMTLSAIFRFNKKIITGTVLAKILIKLTSSETKEGGPYYTHLNKKDTDIDLGTNVIISLFLSLQDVNLPNLDKFVDEAIDNNTVESKYINKIHLLYLVAITYHGSREHTLANQIKQTESNNPTEAAFLQAALLKQNQLQRSVNIEQKTVLNNPDPLYITIELLNNHVFKTSSKTNNDSTYTREELTVMNHILKLAKKRFSSLPIEIEKMAMLAIQKTIKGNLDKQMPLMPYYFKKALGKNGSNISDELIYKMGLSNTFFWTAFIIYDDFWDCDEEANPSLLPIANLFARHYVDFFTTLLPDESGFSDFFHEIMDHLDTANTWETLYCRTLVKDSVFHIPQTLPNYGDYSYKYYPASGHILSSIAMLNHIGFKLKSPTVQNIISYFKNYLIGMQINDDAHDWEEDMSRGHLSTVVVMLLEDYLKANPGKNQIHLKNDLQELKQIYWFKTIKKACETAVKHTQKARDTLNSIEIIEYKSPLMRFVDITQNVAQKAIDEQTSSTELIKEFKKI